ncbi:MAG: V-type ATPase subunit [Clostridia bacterium]|nr:V-type ATPase subunit [Clostridia bacterium]
MAFRSPAVFAKLKAMGALSLTEQDYKEMMSKKSVGEVCGYLKNYTGYSGILHDINESEIHRGELELFVETKAKEEYKRIYKFMGLYDRKLLQYFLIREEVEFIKHCLRYIFSRETEQEIPLENWISPFFREHSRLNLDRITQARDFSSFLDACQDTDYYRVLKRAGDVKVDLFTAIMMLDSFYYNRLWNIVEKYALKKEKEMLEFYLGTIIDLLNILWIYRSKKYYQTPNEIIYTYLIPVRYKLLREDISRMVESENIDDIIKIVSKTRYKALFDDVEKGIFIEINYKKVLYKTARKVFLMSPGSVAAVFAYFHIKENEIENIKTIIEGIRYGLDTDSISELLIL